jgi:predicted nuclease of predicted toxin-antitoxin system
VRFLADMGISSGVVAFLAGIGYEAVHLLDQGLERLPDPEILTKARDEDRILLTHDLGFGELVAASGEQLPSVIIFRLRNMQPGHVNLYVRNVITEYRDTLIDGAVISVTEGQVRSRSLPIRRGTGQPRPKT